MACLQLTIIKEDHRLGSLNELLIDVIELYVYSGPGLSPPPMITFSNVSNRRRNLPPCIVKPYTFPNSCRNGLDGVEFGPG